MPHSPAPWTYEWYYATERVNDGTHAGWQPPACIALGQCIYCQWADGELVRAVSENGKSYHVHRFKSDVGWKEIYAADGTKIIGTFGNEDGGICSSEDDARLVIAAPELVAALQHQISRNHEYSDGCDGCLKASVALRKAGVMGT